MNKVFLTIALENRLIYKSNGLLKIKRNKTKIICANSNKILFGKFIGPDDFNNSLNKGIFL